MFSSVSLLPIQSNRFLPSTKNKLNFSKICLVCKAWKQWVDFYVAFEWEKYLFEISHSIRNNYSVIEIGKKILLGEIKDSSHSSILSIVLSKLKYQLAVNSNQFDIEVINNQFFAIWMKDSDVSLRGQIWDIDHLDNAIFQFYEESDGEVIFVDLFFITKLSCHHKIKVVQIDTKQSYEFTFIDAIDEIDQGIFLKEKNSLVLFTSNDMICLDLSQNTYKQDKNKQVFFYPSNTYGRYICNYDYKEQTIYLFDTYLLKNYPFIAKIFDLNRLGNASKTTMIYADFPHQVADICFYRLDTKEKMVLNIPNRFLKYEIEMIYMTSNHIVIDVICGNLIIDQNGKFVRYIDEDCTIEDNNIIYTKQNETYIFNLITYQIRKKIN